MLGFVDRLSNSLTCLVVVSSATGWVLPAIWQLFHGVGALILLPVASMSDVNCFKSSDSMLSTSADSCFHAKRVYSSCLLTSPVPWEDFIENPIRSSKPKHDRAQSGPCFRTYWTRWQPMLCRLSPQFWGPIYSVSNDI
ncbi:hypothetical protein DPMN_051234 [Dreissena polymorpha]|uniref:Uncharacterized protein n=1 Tax=Dreissena polymorpha TaxID=45954 RepID=A0A9D4CIM9_DREPO|nr:hypothetical protein DPMN_051234 [Dreissena polymorpha]